MHRHKASASRADVVTRAQLRFETAFDENPAARLELPLPPQPGAQAAVAPELLVIIPIGVALVW
jgi:hypothetical protein